MTDPYLYIAAVLSLVNPVVPAVNLPVNGLTGDGVCHLASLIFWAAHEAGLSTLAPTNHDFAVINEIPKSYGVSIYNLPGGFDIGAKQNLYITNNRSSPVTFVFDYDGDNLSLKIISSNDLLSDLVD